MPVVTLENKTLKMEFNTVNGALTRLTSKVTGWELLNRPQLGLSFRMMVPLPGKRNNDVIGEKQAVTSCLVAKNKKEITFVWDGVTSEFGGFHKIKVTIKIKLTDKQAIYYSTIKNDSSYMVENFYCPYIGDIQHPKNDEWTKFTFPGYSSVNDWSLWPEFINTKGYFGVDYPIQICGNFPYQVFILLRTPTQGLYMGPATNSCDTHAWHAELRPGWSSEMEKKVPETLTMAGKDVHTRFGAIHIPYINPGETRELTPIVLQAYKGGWHVGADIYKEWQSKWLKTSKKASWAKGVHSWLQLHINSPEDELRMKFKDLPKVGEECARHGIAAIQLVGWNDGGQDQGNPSHDPDPRLGTFEELKEAIVKIHAMGVKVILFAKFTWADQGTKDFVKKYKKLTIKDPYGNHYYHPGYQYQTATQLMDINTKRLIPMCLQDKEYLKLCNKEFQKTLDLGAAGILFDECFHHHSTQACFDMSHGHRYGAPVYANDRQLIKNFRKLSDKVNKDFLYAGEAIYFWEFETYENSYFRSGERGHTPISRYIFPTANIMTAITGFEDRNMVNQCLLYKYVISHEPYNFKGHLDDYPVTLEYAKKMDVLRTELADYFWHGEFRDTVGVSVKDAKGKAHHPYTSFINRKTKKLGVAIANYNNKKAVSLKIKADNGQSFKKYRLVDGGEWKNASGKIVVPAESAVVVI